MEMLVEEREVGESIIVMPTMILEQPTSEEAEILSEIDDSIEELAQEIESVPEAVIEEEAPRENETVSDLEQMKAQVAELERQIEENSTD